MLLSGKPDAIESAVAAGTVPLLKPVTSERLSQLLGEVFGQSRAES